MAIKGQEMNNKFKHPFTTPDAYFDELQKGIMDKTPGSLLHKSGKENIYTVPEQFFETQYHEILNKKASAPAPIHLPQKSLAWVGIAVASVALVLFSYSYFGTDTINDILSKEGQIIQSDISDIPPVLDSTKSNEDKDSLAKATK